MKWKEVLKYDGNILTSAISVVIALADVHKMLGEDFN